MTEKIEWYKEVLELEPNSKVFFPLARLLVEEGRTEEAAGVLELGLARHDEFLEARLFLIELLYKTGQQSACESQVKKLSRMFSTYSGFWQAWAATLAAEDLGPDTSVVMRFLALNFAKGPVSLNDVLEQGLTSLMGQKTPQAGHTHARAVPEQQSVKPQVSHEDFAYNETAGSPAAHHTPEEGMPLEHAAPQGFAQAANIPVETCPTSDTSALSAVENAHDRLTNEYLPDDLMSEDGLHHQALKGFDPDATTDEEGALPEITILMADAGSSDDSAYEAGQSAPQHGGASASRAAAENQTPTTGEEAEEGEERFSLRTRSMAEVLAEQGDVKGALDIYHELAAAATAPEENADLRQRIATLNARLGSAQPVEQTLEIAEPEGATGKDKLISMLEALAERVEARAHS